MDARKQLSILSPDSSPDKRIEPTENPFEQSKSDCSGEEEEEEEQTAAFRIAELKRRSNKMATKIIQKTFSGKEDFDDLKTKIEMSPSRSESPSHLDLTINSQGTEDSMTQKCNDEVEERNNEIIDLFKGVSMEQVMKMQKKEDILRMNKIEEDLLKIESEQKFHGRSVDKFQVLNDFRMKNKMGRTSLHICCLDQNPRILKLSLQNIKEHCKTKYEQTRILKEILNIEDKYENTPLQLACIYNNELKIEDKRQTISMLLQNGADPNIFNKSTGFSSLHWCARYGETENARMLLKHGAKDYIPDRRGHIPIDYAGKFGHDQCVRRILESALENLRGFQKQSPQSMKRNQVLVYSDAFKESRIYHTSLLYWASTLCDHDFPLEQFKTMLMTLRAYPEGPVKMTNFRTPLHAASSHGRTEKLELLLDDIKTRHEKVKTLMSSGQLKSLSEVDKVFYKKLDLQHLATMKTLLGLKKYKKSKAIHKLFISRLEEYKKIPTQKKNVKNKKMFSYDLLDNDGQTPLYFACLNKQVACAKILIYAYGCSLDISSKNGVKPRDISQIQEVLVDFHDKVDKHISQQCGLEESREENEDLKETLDEENLLKGPRKTVDEELIRKNCHANLIQYYKDRHSTKDTEVIEQTLSARDQLPQVSYLALKIRIDEMHKNRLNYIIANLIQSHFEVKMFHAVENPSKVFYVCLDLDLERLEIAAEQMQYPIKLAEKSLKFKYLKAFKTRYEPFRTKDKEEIMFQILKKQVSMDLLKSKGILLQHFFVHDMNDIYDVQQKVKETSLLQILKQCYVESQYNEYRQLTAVKNYFGERIGFEYAFMNFYTSYLIVPAIFGVIVVILNGQAENQVTLLSFAYAAVISIWISVFNERWKRKTNELRINWGTLVQAGAVNQEQIRNEFDGDEEFSHENYNVNRSDIQKRGNWFIVLNILISMVFIATCITIFLVLKNIEINNKYYQRFEGVVNGIIIGAINYVYQLIAAPLVDLENHKYESTYIKSFTFKIFIFKFFNTNISLAYTIYMSNEQQVQGPDIEVSKSKQIQLEREAIDRLYSLLLGMMLTKVASMFASKCIWRITLFKLKKFFYFRTVKNLGLEQNRQHQACSQYNKIERQKTFAAGALHDSYIYRQKDVYEYKRLVTVFNQIPSRDSKRPNPKSCILRDQQLIDQVELNSRMKILTMTWELGEQSEAFIFLSFCTLYSALCPIVSLIVFVHNFLANKWQRYVRIRYVQRNGVIQQNGLGPWTSILEFLAYATVISNCLFLYMFRSQFARVVATETYKFYGNFKDEDQALHVVKELNNFFGDEQKKYSQVLDEPVYDKTIKEIERHLKQVFNEEVIVQFIIMIIVLEHIILIFKTVLLSFIGEKPHWVTKHEVRVEYEIDMLNVEEKKLEQALMIQELEKTLDQQSISFKNIIDKVTSNYKKISRNSKILKNQLKNELNVQDDLRDQLNKSQAELMTLGQRDSMKRKREDQELEKLRSAVQQLEEDLDNSQNAQPTLTKFIDSRFKLQLNNSPYSDEIESRMHEHLQIRLFRETYNIIEAQILQRRLQKMSQSERFVMVSCSECTARFAEYECPECGNDCFCKICFHEVHTQQLARHQPMPIQPDQSELVNVIHQKSKSNFMKVGLRKFNEIHVGQTKDSHWIKFEQFNFPLPESNDLFIQLRHYFQYFKESYVQLNAISDLDKKIDLAKLLLDKNYAIFGDKLREVIVKGLNTERKGESRQNKKHQMRIVDQAKAELSQNEKSILEKQPATLRGEKMFNEEELLFLNRMGFYVICKHGPLASFKEFIENLSILQDGTLEQKLDIVIDFCKQGRMQSQRYIEIETFINMIMSSMPQDQKLRANASYLLQITIKDDYEDELIDLNGSRNNLNDTLDSQTSLTQSFTRKNTHIEENELRNIILTNSKVKAIIKCVLQIK